MELKEKLSQLRKNRELSQLELAEMLDVSRQAVSRWENGLSVPSMNKLKQLSDLYGVSLDSLLGDTQDVSPSLNPENETSKNNSDESADKQDLHKRSWVCVKWALAITFIVALIVIVSFSMSRKNRNDNYIIMSDIKPTETAPILSEGFSITW